MAPPETAVFPQGRRVVNTEFGRVEVIAPKDISLKEFTKAFAPIYERIRNEARTKAVRHAATEGAPHHSPK